MPTRNPVNSPVEVGRKYPMIYKVSKTSRSGGVVGLGNSEPSTVSTFIPCKTQKTLTFHQLSKKFLGNT